MLPKIMNIRQIVSGMVGIVGGLLALWTILLLLGQPMEWQAILSAWPAYVWACTWFVLLVVLGEFFAHAPPNIPIELARAIVGITAFVLGGILGGLFLLILLFVMPEYYIGVSLFRVIFAIFVSAFNCAGCFFLSIKLYPPIRFGKMHKELIGEELKKEERVVPAEWWNNKGVSLNDLGKHEEAIECFDKALEINPRLFEPWNNKGLALKNLGRYEEAIKCFNRALEIDPRQAKVWSNQGRALYSLGRFDGSIRCYDKALEINPGLAGVWNNKGISLAGLNRFDGAISCHDRALEIDPSYLFAWNSKGISLLHLGRFAEAIGCFDKALEIDPTFEPAKRNRAFCLLNMNR